MNTLSADRTRSRRWRSGTRRKKHHPTILVEVCSESKICIIHNPRFTPPAERLRVRLTQCEQRWVDDVRAGRKHLHGDLKGSSKSMVRQRRIAGIRRRMSIAGMDYGYPNHMRVSDGTSGYHNPGDRVIAAIDYTPPPGVDVSGLRDTVIRAAEAEKSRLMVGTAQYGRGKRIDISDRWYPRGD
jgi:hypothetical protein